MQTKPSVPSRRTSAQWEHIVEQSEATTLSLRAFCHEMGLSLQSLYYWRSKFQRRPRRKSRGFTQLQPAQLSAPLPKQVEGTMELRLTNGRVVRITGGGVDAQALRTLIEVAEAGGAC